MAEEIKTWILTLRCHACSHRFVVRGVTTDRIGIMPQIIPCPSCLTKSVTTIEDNVKIIKTHKILDMQQKKFP
jgi:DNA-directed RNA polymerase subunit RPC12/RpoP